LNQATLDHNYEWINKFKPHKTHTHTQQAAESSSNQLGFGDIKAHVQQLIPRTLKVLGLVNGSSVAIPVDNGRIHNFIQDHITKLLGLQVSPTQNFHVLIENGNELSCSSICKRVALQLSLNTFPVDLYTLPLSGVKIVLGIQWLAMLG